MGASRSRLRRGWQVYVLVLLLLFVGGVFSAATGHDNWAVVLLEAAVGLAVSASAPLFARLSHRDEFYG
jgi:hypothetical protein